MQESVSSMPPIIHVVRQYAPAVGGLENFVKALAEQQVKQGLDVTVVTLNRGFSDNRTYPDRENINGVRVIRIPFSGSKRYPIAPTVLRHIVPGAVVHVHCTDFFSDFLAITRPVHRATLVLSTHGGFFHTKFAGRLKLIFFNLITRFTLKAYKRIYACSIGDYERFSSVTSNVELIENGVEVDRFHLAEKQSSASANRFLYIGRFSSNKRIDNLIRVFSSVITQLDDAHLTIVGNDYDGLAKGYKQQISDYGLEDRISLVSGASDEALLKIVSESQYIVSASEYEGFGMTIIEGMAGGLIPVVNYIPSFNKIVADSDVGIVCDFDQESASQSILQFIRESDADGQARKAVSFSDKYSWQRVERTFFDAYERVLGVHTMNIQGVEISNVSATQAIDRIKTGMANGLVKLAFANAHSVNVSHDDPEYKELLSDFLVLADGVGVDIAARIKYGRKFKENLNGTDFVPLLMERLEPARIFILGGKPGVAERAREIFEQKYPHHTWVGSHHGYINDEQSSDIDRQLLSQNINILLVAMGNPLQEKWIFDHAEQAGVKLAVGVGALLDFTAGEVKRAPEWARKLRVEWVYRLMLEPKRMWRRYVLGNLVFLSRGCLSGKR